MIEVKQLRESISKALKEFYEVPLDESINMELVYFGKHDGLDRYELDGIEFFVAEDEDLQNAIETCIDEEFMPEWKENSKAVDFSIDSVDFIEGKDEKGFVGITVFGEELDESLNESVSTENIKEAVLNAIKEHNHEDPVESIFQGADEIVVKLKPQCSDISLKELFKFLELGLHKDFNEHMLFLKSGRIVVRRDNNTFDTLNFYPNKWEDRDFKIEAAAGSLFEMSYHVSI